MASIMPDEVGPAIAQTVEALQKGGIYRLGAEAALPVVAGWQHSLEETGHPELLPVAATLAELRVQLSGGGGTDPAIVGALLGTLGVQVRGVADSEAGAGVSGELRRLSLVLSGQGHALVSLAN